MAIIGHKERALLRRGTNVQESLKRRMNLTESASLRRNIVEEPTEGFQSDKLKLHGLCGDDISVGIKQEDSAYCRVIELLNNMSDTLAKETYEAMDEIYKWYRSRIKNDNRTLFKKTLEVILNNENPSVAFKLIASYLKDPAINPKDILDSLKSFIKDNGDIKEDALDDFLRKARAVEYSKYEQSFVGDHFDLLRGYIELSHGHDESSFYKIVIGVLEGKYTIEESISVITNTILATNIDDLVGKADLNLKSDLKVGDEVVLSKDSKVEVKKMDYKLDSYFSEFFAIYKNPKNFLKYVDNPNFRLAYNTIIDGVYRRLVTEGEGILESIGNSIDAIMYEKNRMILSDDIELYWSNKGQRACDDHRLTIRYRLNKTNVVSYIYSNGSDQLEVIPVDVELRPQLSCPIV
jgi:hypothetical protein